MNLNEIAKAAYNIARQREKNGAGKIRDILKQMAGEVVEVAEARQYWICDDSDAVDDYAEELADVVICALIAAGSDNIDIEAAINAKMQKNAQRAALQGDKA